MIIFTYNKLTNMLQITLSAKAAVTFERDLRNNGIDWQYTVRTSYYFLEDSPKLRMAVQMAKQRHGTGCIVVTHLD